tara:strand:+ start:553 stop:1818 length:1266 start_codon:yes stop_codon:yes gene_type:complete
MHLKTDNHSLPFFKKDFFRLWFAVFIFSAGMYQEQISVGYIIYELTNSEIHVILMYAVRVMPVLFFSNYIGYIADLINRKKLLSIFMFLGSIGMFLFSLLMYFEIYNYPIIMTFVFYSGCIWAAVMITQQSYSYDIVGPKFVSQGTALTKGADRIGGILGGYFSGKLVSNYFHIPFLLSALYHLCSSSLILPNSKIANYSPISKSKEKPQISEILSILKNNNVLLVLIILTIITEIFGFSHNSIMPILVKDVLSGDADDLGFMMIVRQFGGIIGILLIIVLGNIQQKGLWLLVSALGMSFCVFFLGLANNSLIFIVALFSLNVFSSSCDSLYQIIAQKSVLNKDRGKALGAWTFALGSGPLGYLIIGLIITAVNTYDFTGLTNQYHNAPGPQLALNLNGFILILLVLVTFRYAKKLREFKT